jgi:hypothetical protein
MVWKKLNACIKLVAHSTTKVKATLAHLRLLRQASKPCKLALKLEALCWVLLRIN